MIIDFKEIPSARGGNEGQDEFELFAREFLSAIGFEVLEGPDRGADGGRDIIVLEKRPGIIGVTDFRWLVSCKHYAHNGHAVGPKDELNVRDRMDRFSCEGFLGFYSTIASGGLTDLLSGLKYKIIDHEIIERMLLEKGEAYSLIQRFFPHSCEQIKSKQMEVSNLLKEYFPLKCDYCGKDLLQCPEEGIYATCEKMTEDSIIVTDAYCACRGNCDRALEEHFYRKDEAITSWHELKDMIIPRYYLAELQGISDNIRNGSVTYEDDAYLKIQNIFVRLAQMVMRRHKESEEDRMTILDQLP